MNQQFDDKEKKNGNFFLPLLIFISQFCAGLIPILCKKKQSSKNNRSYSGVELIQNKLEIIQPDSQTKIYILIMFASYFNCIGSLIRKQKTDFQLENRTRGFQIIFCAILCYFTIRINKYKHQIFSLIIIFIIIIIILAIDLIFFKKKIELLISYGYGIFSCFSRAFLDTIEKYLFEFDYLNPYKVLMLEGLIGCLFISIYFLDSTTYEDFNSFKSFSKYLFYSLIIYMK
jgi:multidrug transporter EmrE-like cation transporter